MKLPGRPVGENAITGLFVVVGLGGMADGSKWNGADQSTRNGIIE